MSSANLHPPQTYSRLFRPWDSTQSSDEDSSSDSNSSDMKQAKASCESQMKKKQAACKEVQQGQPPTAFSGCPGGPYGMDGLQFPCGFPAINDFYQYNAPQPNFLMDPLAITLMEQEYARVMAEDAHLKAMNSKKQRPKKFKCPHCDVAFSNNGQLKGHIRIHTGERPFKCDVETCGKTFTRNEELTRHKRIHTGLRPYPCTTCGKKFGRRDHLKKHMKTHMPQERQLGTSMIVPVYPYLFGY